MLDQESRTTYMKDRPFTLPAIRNRSRHPAGSNSSSTSSERYSPAEGVEDHFPEMKHFSTTPEEEATDSRQYRAFTVLIPTMEDPTESGTSCTNEGPNFR